MSFADVVEYEDDGGAGSDDAETTGTADTTEDGDSTMESETFDFQANIPEVGRVEEWLAARNLTVQETILVIQTVNLVVFTAVTVMEVRDG